MSRDTARKLTLSRETVRLLSDAEARAVAGGAVTQAVCNGISQNTCNMACNYSQPTDCLTGMWCLNSTLCP
jgi:hypothetical protein